MLEKLVHNYSVLENVTHVTEICLVLNANTNFQRNNVIFSLYSAMLFCCFNTLQTPVLKAFVKSKKS